MLKLVNITKIYSSTSEEVLALNNLSVEFRKNEFVSILGQSGCGKTTLLNIIGGLDRYTDGDLIIKGRSTKNYNDHDWDTYRNHSIGFVFQSYNLIPHQTVLANVELALTLSGVSKKERRRRAIEALQKVGLGDQLKKKPNQMSGGQMQRVAIARALINNPEILLADEPTGALDSDTSEQIMQLLKEVANDRLVIMVTHNPELAQRYSTRIIKLLDGKMIDDSNPFDSTAEQDNSLAKTEQAKKTKRRKKGTSMSFFTALFLSLNNLLTKKGRTIMTSFAGSIGIIGIALILSLSSGFQAYINKVQEETLSSYPITIESETVDMSELMESFIENGNKKDFKPEPDKIYANTDMYDMLEAYMNPEVNSNNLEKLKAWIETDGRLKSYASAIKYSYDNAALKVYIDDPSGAILPANDYMSLFEGMYTDSSAQMANSMQTMVPIKVFDQILDGKNGEAISDMMFSQYELIGDNMKWPQNKNEVVLIVDKNNQIPETFLYALGLIDRSIISDLMMQIMTGEQLVDDNATISEWSFDDIIGRKYKLILPTDIYLATDTDKDSVNDKWIDMSKDEAYMKLLLNSAETLEIVGIIRPKEDAVATAMNNCAVGYLSSLTDWYIDKINNSELVKYQLENPDTDVLKGLPFVWQETSGTNNVEGSKAEEFIKWCESLSETRKAEIFTIISTTPDKATLNAAIQGSMAQLPNRDAKENMIINAYVTQGNMDEETVRSFIGNMSDEELDKTVTDLITIATTKNYAEQAQKQLSFMDTAQRAAALSALIASSDSTRLAELYDMTAENRYSSSTLSANLDKMGYTEKSKPSAINLYAATFENKDKIAALIEEYNSTATEEDKITYTDYVALIMSSISTIINVISYVLMAFVSISLVVSSIMIGIITYISVLERTKEIGILRSIGASKRDISRVFNAETLIVGFVAGALGILVTLLLNIPINIIINSLSDIKNVAYLPFGGAVILVAISMTLTLISGLIPAKLAAKKDPVVALRTE